MHEIASEMQSLSIGSGLTHEYGKISAISEWHRLRRRTIVFVRTERNETMEIHGNQKVSVKPTGKTSWLLFTVADGEEMPIGVVDHIEEANAALISIREAIQADLGWDFKQYIEEYD